MATVRFRLSVWFLKWAMHRCIFGKDTLRQIPALGPKHLTAIVAQSDYRCTTYQALCWRGIPTIHVGMIQRREAFNIRYVRNQHQLLKFFGKYLEIICRSKQIIE